MEEIKVNILGQPKTIGLQGFLNLTTLVTEAEIK